MLLLMRTRLIFSLLTSVRLSENLAIDEGFGNLDTNNLNSIFMLFDYLKTEFEYIMVISHIDLMRDITDNLLEISKQQGLSKVLYN